jgi:hypothetical protein
MVAWIRRLVANACRGGADQSGFAHQTLSVTVITMSSDLFKREVATVAGMAGTSVTAVCCCSLLIGPWLLRLDIPFLICLGIRSCGCVDSGL